MGVELRAGRYAALGQERARPFTLAGKVDVLDVRDQAFIGQLDVLLAFVAMIALVNGILSYLGGFLGFEQLTLQQILGVLLAPLAFLLTIPWEEANTAGSLIGQKLVLNEFYAYTQFAGIRETLSEHTQIVITFALCGFANLSSIAMLLGGLGTIVPERRHDIARLGLRAVLGGTLSNLMSAVLAGLFFSLKAVGAG